ncbi:MAG TPA: hypothetical protein P5037_13130 [Candidatus Paceibacterota bacterium]|jgi:N-acyl-D-amino-acid deacylase|nr:hypothetical protein [Verrucomicrobiota bacterium]HRY59631.1 hypothetical protein [Candidatus Paceibacterota bacterium]HOW79131.1 hypothetical protein [Verrucomicrobiota bacterium]HQE90553.1 hypothetical protein [Verrucomicrobiota bacterium]HQH02764.1 hypothetical protein [Verrucomicrobiota bacterium]
MRIGLFAWLILLAALTAPTRGAESYDLVIRHGRVVDGSGNPAFFADVAVRQGRIAALGRIERAGRIEINAAGLIVAPGFIDVHTHADEVATRPLAENFVRMGGDDRGRGQLRQLHAGRRPVLSRDRAHQRRRQRRHAHRPQ